MCVCVFGGGGGGVGGMNPLFVKRVHNKKFLLRSPWIKPF